MTVLVVGSVALDSVETPFGRADNVLGGSGTFFSLARAVPPRPERRRDARDASGSVLELSPEDSRAVSESAVRLSGQHRPAVAARRADAGRQAHTRRVRHDEFLDREPAPGHSQ